MSDPSAAAQILAIERDSQEIRLQLEIPTDLVWFEGHFPDCPILPGVVQTHWAIEFGRQHWDIRGQFQALSNVKFMQVIEPGMRLLLALRFDAENQALSFRLFACRERVLSRLRPICSPGSMKPCIVIPFYNHAGAIAAVVSALKRFHLPCIIVNDGSDAACAPVLRVLAATEGDWVQVIERETNGGKGAAVMTGCEAAAVSGFTHVLQIDADGQHDTRDVPKALELAAQHPDALISGYAIYDESVPAARRYGRYITHCWVWINTWSLQIRDSMCGFRVYPLAAARRVWASRRMSRRMDFDIEIMVRMYWNGTPVLSFPTHVTYPQDGISHFDALRDNIRISVIHARLFAGMMWRIPRLVLRTFIRRPRRVVA